MKFFAAICILFVGAVKGCTKDEEAKRVGDFRADVSKNIENLKKIAGSNAQVLELMKARVTCAGMKDFVSTICTGGPRVGLDMATNCCHTCAPETTTAKQTTAAPTTPARTTPAPRTTAAATNPPRTTAAAQGCTQAEEAKRVGDFRADIKDNMDTIKLILGSKADVLASVKDTVTCAQVKGCIALT